MPQQKRRNPWLAGIGNLLYAPLGHVYAGQAWRGVLMCAAIMSITLVALCAVSRAVGRAGLLLTALVLIAAPLCLVADAALVARRQGSDYHLQWYNRWYVYLLTAVMAWGATQAIVYVLRAYIVQAYYIPSGAMMPSLLIDDRFVLDKLAYRWHPPARFDVVVFRAPKKLSPGDEKEFVKRVIGLPGDVIQVFPDAVMVDGRRAVQLLDEYAHDPSCNFLGAVPHGLAVERDQLPKLLGNLVLSVNGEPRVVVTPTGKAQYRDGELWVDGQRITYVVGPGRYHTDHNPARFGAEPGVQGTVYYLGQAKDQPALIVLKGKQLSLRGGYVSVNGRPLKEPYIKETPRYELPAYKLSANQYFVLGDNRNDSNDSHAWGPLARDRISGVALTIYWSGNAETGIRWERIGRPLR
jgi:signal peptidase I